LDLLIILSDSAIQLRYCYDEAYFFYHKNLLMGFAIDDFKRAASRVRPNPGIPPDSRNFMVEPQGNTSLRIP
jgi:hypothetical protein